MTGLSLGSHDLVRLRPQCTYKSKLSSAIRVRGVDELVSPSWTETTRHAGAAQTVRGGTGVEATGMEFFFVAGRLQPAKEKIANKSRHQAGESCHLKECTQVRRRAILFVACPPRFQVGWWSLLGERYAGYLYCISDHVWMGDRRLAIDGDWNPAHAQDLCTFHT